MGYGLPLPLYIATFSVATTECIKSLYLQGLSAPKAERGITETDVVPPKSVELPRKKSVFAGVGITATSVGTEELGHLEMVGTIVHQLTRNMSVEDVKRAGLENYFVDHTAGVYPQSAGGTPWTAAGMQVAGDTIADLTEDMAADDALF